MTDVRPTFADVEAARERLAGIARVTPVFSSETLSRLAGAYVYADYVSGRVWALRREKGSVTAHREILPPRPGGFFVTSFGEDEAGELYLCVFDSLDGNQNPAGRIYRLVER